MSSPVVRIQGIKKSYRSGDAVLEVLKGIDLTIEHGDFIGIMGPSGSGKSTLLSIIGTIERPDEGEVFYGEEAVTSLDDDALSRLRNERIGFVFQFHNLLPEFSALENVMLPLLIRRIRRKEAEERSKELLIKFGLLERAHHLPSELSGGERQRIAVARALITGPDILLADEPTGNLDRRNADMLMELLLKLNEEGTTIVLVTHNEQLGRYFKTTYHLSDGRLT